MTPTQKENLYKFLWDESMLYEEEEMKLIEKWIDENIVTMTPEQVLKLYENEIIKLKSALTQSVELLKEWHNRGAYITGKSQSVIDEIWDVYYKNAPELKGIREALKETVK